MKLQAKVTLIIAATWLIIGAIIFADSKLIISRSFQRVESQLIQNEIQDTKRALDRMLYTLSLYAQAFSQWDDAYDFLQNKNPKFIKSNFLPGTYTSSKIDFLMYYDLSGRLYHGAAYNASSDSLTPLPKSLINYLDRHPNFLKHTTFPASQSGIIDASGMIDIIDTGHDLIVMTSQPVITSDGKGPMRGTLLMGYKLTNSQFKILSETVGLRLNFFHMSTVEKNPQLHAEFIKLKNNNQSATLVNNKIAYGFLILTDIDQNPVGMLRIEIPRTVYQQGLSTTYHYFVIVSILGLIILFLTWYLLKFFVINRVISISNQVAKINDENKFDRKINFSGNDELYNMVQAVNHMMQIISQSQNKLRYMAMYDSLTELPNRQFFYDLLEKEFGIAEQKQLKIAIMFLDIDKLKFVNDQYGHAAGDILIKHAAERIKNSIKNIDVVARQSGDEFLLFLRNIQNISSVSDVAQRIIHSISLPFHINGEKINVTSSIGISIYPDDGKTVDELIKKADQMMYKTKKESGNNYRFYREENSQKITLD